MVVVALLDAEPAVVAPRRHVRRGEVAAVGGAVEVQVMRVITLDQMNRPGHVHRIPAAVEGDSMAVLVGVQVRAVHAAAQPHVLAVMELLHLSPVKMESRGARGKERWVLGFLALRRGGEEKKRELLVETVALGAKAEYLFKARLSALGGPLDIGPDARTSLIQPT